MLYLNSQTNNSFVRIMIKFDCFSFKDGYLIYSGYLIIEVMFIQDFFCTPLWRSGEIEFHNYRLEKYKELW